jgi:hypothetical protein
MPYFGAKLTYDVNSIIYSNNMFMIQATGDNLIKLFPLVIFCNSVVLLSFLVIKYYYCGNYLARTANYHGKKLYNIGPLCLLNMMVIYRCILTLENVGTSVYYCDIFILFAPGACTIKLFTTVIDGNP